MGDLRIYLALDELFVQNFHDFVVISVADVGQIRIAENLFLNKRKWVTNYFYWDVRSDRDFLLDETFFEGNRGKQMKFLLIETISFPSETRIESFVEESVFAAILP